MSLRFTPEAAVAMGLLSKEDAQQMKQAGKRNMTPAQERLMKAKAARAPTSNSLAAQQLAAANDPQTILYDALVERLPVGAVKWEVPDLIAGRQFRVDILVGTQIIVELDGFAYCEVKQHSKKTANARTYLPQRVILYSGHLLAR